MNITRKYSCTEHTGKILDPVWCRAQIGVLEAKRSKINYANVLKCQAVTSILCIRF